MLRSRQRVVTTQRCATALAAFLLFVASPAQVQAQAQTPTERSGFWLSLGAGSGWDVPASLVPRGRPEGTAVLLRAGGTASPQVLIGAELLGRSVRRAGALEFRGNASFTILVFPSSSGSYFLKGGIGPAILGQSTVGGYRGTYTLGPGATAGAGFNLRLLWNLYLTPSIDFVYQSFYAGPDLRDTHGLLLGTIGLTWH